jgi:predicted MFS family arabinose efflux permease
MVGLMSLGVALWTWLMVPGGLHIAPLDRAAWLRLARHPALLLVVAVTVVQASAQFVLYSYLVPVLQFQAGLSSVLSGTVFGVLGVFGVAGNLLGARLSDRIGAARVVQLALWTMLLAFALWPLIRLSGGHWLLIGSICAIWGLPVFACNAAQQARLVALAPDLASASVALNSSGMYLGQAIGAGVGGWVISHQGYDLLNWWAMAIMVLAIGVSIRAASAAHKSQLV